MRIEISHWEGEKGGGENKLGDHKPSNKAPRQFSRCENSKVHGKRQESLQTSDFEGTGMSSMNTISFLSPSVQARARGEREAYRDRTLREF